MVGRITTGQAYGLGREAESSHLKAKTVKLEVGQKYELSKSKPSDILPSSPNLNNVLFI